MRCFRDRATARIVGAVLGALLLVRPVAAHVRYVTDEDGEAISFRELLRAILLDPVNATLLLGGALATLFVVVAYVRYRPARYDVAVLRSTVREYTDLVPWMLRLSVGLPLVGAGFAGYLFSPNVEVSLRAFQVAVGFLLLFGLATRTVAAVGLGAYLVGLAFYPDLLLAGEYIAGFLAIVLVGGGRPSADQMLHQVARAEHTLYGRVDRVHLAADWLNRRMEPYEEYAPFVVRVGLGLTFVNLGLVEKLLDPGRAELVVFQYDLTAVVPVDPALWVFGAGLVEVVLGVTLLAGLFTRAAAAVAFLMFTLTLFGLPDDPVLAHVTYFGLVSVLFITGSGPLALDNWIDETVPEVETSVTGT